MSDDQNIPADDQSSSDVSSPNDDENQSSDSSSHVEYEQYSQKSAAENIISDRKMKGIYRNPVIPLSNYRFDDDIVVGRRKNSNSIVEIGEPSCGNCVICEDAKPIRLTFGGSCGHRFCLVCFQVYVAHKMNRENKLTVKCPEKDCMEEFDYRVHVPEQVYRRKWNSYSEGLCLTLQQKLQCPCCRGVIIDDERRCIIRACTKCWRLFCYRCMIPWHVGNSCGVVQARRLRFTAFLMQSPMQICPVCEQVFPDQNGRPILLARICCFCRSPICTLCMVPWHKNMTCTMYQARRLLFVASLLESP